MSEKSESGMAKLASIERKLALAVKLREIIAAEICEMEAKGVASTFDVEVLQGELNMISNNQHRKNDPVVMVEQLQQSLKTSGISPEYRECIRRIFNRVRLEVDPRDQEEFSTWGERDKFYVK